MAAPNFARILRASFVKAGPVRVSGVPAILLGASAVVLASDTAVSELGVEPLARVVSSATYALDPQVMGIAPAWAIPKAIERARLAPEQIDVWEVHEAGLGATAFLPGKPDTYDLVQIAALHLCVASALRCDDRQISVSTVFLRTNDEREWTDRKLPGAMKGTWGDRHAVWENEVLLANETGKDLYITVPINASPDYVSKLANLLRFGSDGVNPYSGPVDNPIYPGLNPNLRVYVEWANEVWNWGFGQTRWAREQGVARSLGDPEHLRFYSQRAVEVFKIWEEVFKADRKRLDDLLPRAYRGPRAPALCGEVGRLFLRFAQDAEGAPWLTAALGADPGWRPAPAALAELYPRRGPPDLARPERKKSSAGSRPARDL